MAGCCFSPARSRKAIERSQTRMASTESEFFDGAPASAHAIAHTDCEVLSIPHEEVKRLAESRPDLSAKFLWAFGRTLASRLRESNQKMASLFAIARDF